MIRPAAVTYSLMILSISFLARGSVIADEPKTEPAAPSAKIDGIGPDWKAFGKDDFVNVNCDLVDDLAVVRRHMLVLWDQIFVSNGIRIGDHQTLLALGVLAERDRTRNFREHARILR